MNIEAVGYLAPEHLPTLAPSGPAVTSGASFAERFGIEMDSLNTQLNTAQREVALFAAGAPVSVHAMMIHLEEARVSLQLLMAMRGKALESLNDVLKMPL